MKSYPVSGEKSEARNGRKFPIHSSVELKLLSKKRFKNDGVENMYIKTQGVQKENQ